MQDDGEGSKDVAVLLICFLRDVSGVGTREVESDKRREGSRSGEKAEVKTGGGSGQKNIDR